MRRETIGEIIFWNAGAMTLVLYALTAPSGLPWNESASAAVADGAIGVHSLPHQVWRYFVAVFDGHFVALACTAAAVAGGLLGTIVNRYLGWRVAGAASLVWMTLPGVWYRAISGERTICYVAVVIATLWLLNAVALFMTRTVRSVRPEKKREEGKFVHDEATKRGRNLNRIASWLILGFAAFFAVTMMATHDYRYGESASAYARLVVQEAGERIIILNGLCDAQIELEVKSRDGVFHQHDVDRTNLVAWAKASFPGETNLWVAAEIGPITFIERAFVLHPERFYSMNGHSTTTEKLEARRQAMAPYFASRDPFIPVLRRALDREADILKKVERRGGGQRDLSSSLTSISFKTLSDLHAAMMKAYYAKHLDKAVGIAREILSHREWSGFVPAHLVMGTATAVTGDYVASEAFYRTALAGKGAAAPRRFVFNDYAEVLRHLGRFDEAETYARKAVEGSDEKDWVYRLTLAQVLRDAGKGAEEKKSGGGEIVRLLESVMKHAPRSERMRIRKEFAK